MNLYLTDEDFNDHLSPDQVQLLTDANVEAQAGSRLADKTRAVIESVPSAIASALNGCKPEGFDVDSFELEISVSGTPFGIGVASKGKVKFTRD